MPSVAESWGATEEERGRSYACDRYLDGDAYFRAVDVAAAPDVLFRWLCQLRVAPYSYDWLDNWGRRSPQELTPGLDRLEVGQRFMTIFDLAEFEQDRQITLLLRRAARLFGSVAVTYLIEPSPERSRLVLKIVADHPGGFAEARLRRLLLPWGDLVMARRQLLNLKRLAEGRGG